MQNAEFGRMKVVLLAVLTAATAVAGIESDLAVYRGRVVVLNFWATWCVPCREEFPLLVRIQNKYAGRGVQVIGASADDESTRGNVDAFTRRMHVNFPIWLNATTADMHRLGLETTLPATAILDQDGTVAFRINGPFQRKDVERRIEWLLGDRKSPAPQAEQHAHHNDAHEHGAVGIEGAATVPS